MRLYLTRHGETIENTKGIWQGHLDGSLTKKGVDQAKKLALRLKEITFDHVYCSDLGRCRNTAKEIIRFHETPVDYVPQLRERDLGSLQGKPHPLLKEEDLPEDVEDLGHFSMRINGFLEEIRKTHENETVLFITHAGPIAAILNRLNNEDMQGFRKHQPSKNTALFIIDLMDDSFKMILENDTSHLN